MVLLYRSTCPAAIPAMLHGWLAAQQTCPVSTPPCPQWPPATACWCLWRWRPAPHTPSGEHYFRSLHSVSVCWKADRNISSCAASRRWRRAPHTLSGESCAWLNFLTGVCWCKANGNTGPQPAAWAASRHEVHCASVAPLHSATSGNLMCRANQILRFRKDLAFFSGDITSTELFKHPE